MKKVYLTIISLLTISACSTPPVNLNNTILTNHQDNTYSIAKREIISRVLGDAPNFAQTSNGNFCSVVSRGYGRGAKAGALIEFFYPNYANDHLWDAYNGIYYNGKLSWFHELELVNQSVKEDSGIIVSNFITKDRKFNIKTQDVALRDNDTHVRNLQITNNSSEEIKDFKTFFYEFFTINYFGAGDTVTYDENSGTLTHYQKDIFFTIGSDKKPSQWQCGGALNVLTNSYDARMDATDGKLKKNLLTKGYIGLGVNGNIGHEFETIKPGETISLNYFISVGRSREESQKNFNLSKIRNWNSIEQGDLNFWKNWLSKSRKPNTSDTRLNRVYRRALITLKQDTANNGAIIASPTLLTPVYSFTWPRDGSISSSAYLLAGYPEEARKFIDFMCKMQKNNGGWAVNFFMDGSRPLWDFGDRKNEHDQVGAMIFSIYEYYNYTKDFSWLSSKRTVVNNAADFIIKYKDQNNLMTACRDLWELHTDKSWTFTNAACAAGLLAASEISGLLGDDFRKNKYKIAGLSIKNAIYEHLWSEQNQYYVRGLNFSNKEYDLKVESANLGLCYPFEIFPYNDKRMVLMADKIYTTLTSTNKGVRRYTNDQYYDGNPWPATTDWLAIFYSKQGNKQRAIELHNAVTNYAFTTDSLMLGEQIDERQNLWVSAFPLTWSEASYILASLEIFH